MKKLVFIFLLSMTLLPVWSFSPNKFDSIEIYGIHKEVYTRISITQDSIYKYYNWKIEFKKSDLETFYFFLKEVENKEINNGFIRLRIDFKEKGEVKESFYFDASEYDLVMKEIKTLLRIE